MNNASLDTVSENSTDPQPYTISAQSPDLNQSTSSVQSANLDQTISSTQSAGAAQSATTAKIVSANELAQHLPRVGPSFGWLTLFLVLFFAAAILYVMGYGAVLGFQAAQQGVAVPDPEQMTLTIQTHFTQPAGVAGLYLLQCIILLPVIVVAAHFPTQRWTQTLGFTRFSARSLMMWLLVWLVYSALSFAINTLAQIEPGEFMRSLNGSRHLGAALVLVIAAPLLEELVFRGYLFKAWRHSRLGLSGTLIVTSILFTLLHLGQYGWVYLTMIFSLSILLGLAREKSGSVWVPILIHAANNLVATVTVIYLGML